jgi:hypothetical protein
MDIRLTDGEWYVFDTRGECLGSEVVYRAKALATYSRLQTLRQELRELGIDPRMMQDVDALARRLEQEIIRDASWLASLPKNRE